MTIRKIEAGRVITKDIDTFVGQEGTIFYDEQTGEFRLSDGITEGGIPLGAGGGGYVLTTATFTRLGGVRIGTGISVSPNGTISVNTGTPYVLNIATTSTLGGVIIGAGIDVSPNGVISVNTGTTYNLTTATVDTLGGVKIGTGIDISADGTISVNTGTIFNLNTATTSTLGGVKIGDGINVSEDGTISVNSSTYFTLTAGTDTAVSTSTGNVTIWTTSTLQSVTNRGSTTSNAINITSVAATTSTTTGALIVAGGVGIGGDLFVGGDITGPNGSLVLIATTSTAPNRQNGQLWFNSEDGRAYIKYNDNWVDFSPTIVPPVSTYLGELTIDGTTISTIDSTLTNIYIDSILDVSGKIYTNNYEVSTLTNISSSIGISVSRTNSGTVTINNTGVLEIVAGVDTSISTTTGSVVINNTSTLQSVTDRGSTTTNAISINNGTTTTSTITGALIVAGGIGIAGDIFIAGDIKDVNGSLIHIATTSTAPERVNGQLWFNSEDGRGYIKYNNNWVDFSPSIVPPTSTYLDGLVVEDTTIRTVDTTATTVYIDSNLDVSGEIFRNGISIGYGYTGSGGFTGSRGYWGSVGFTGSTGTQGEVGFTGSTGTQGEVGFTGSTGTQGEVGFTGSTGTQGEVGFTGSTGTQGEVGFTGSTGTQGEVGFTGSTGTQGEIGYTGSAVIGLTSNATDTVTLSAGFKFIPETDKIQDLGSPTNRFGKIYLAGQTIDLGGTIISTAPDGSVLIQKTNGDLEKLAASSLTLGSTGTSGVILSVTNGNLVVQSDILSVRGIISTTTVTATNIVINGSVESTSTYTGSLIVSGGVGISGNLYVGGEIVSQKLTIEYTTITTTIVVTDDIIKTSNTTISTSTDTGALVIAGGAGIGGDLNIGRALYANTTSFVFGAEIITTATIALYSSKTILTAGTDTAISTSTGNITIWNTSNLQSITDRGNSTTNAISITNSTISTSTDTGALIVTGGVGIGGALYANTTSFVAGAEIITTGTIEKYAVTPTGIQTLTNKTIIVPTGGALYFDSDVLLSQAHNAIVPYKQTSAAPKMYTNKDFNTGIVWLDAGGFDPNDGWNVIDTVTDSSYLPVGYTGGVWDAYVTTNDNHVWYWAAPSTGDLKPGDYYYDEVNSSLSICYAYIDPNTGNFQYALVNVKT